MRKVANIVFGLWALAHGAFCLAVPLGILDALEAHRLIHLSWLKALGGTGFVVLLFLTMVPPFACAITAEGPPIDLLRVWRRFPFSGTLVLASFALAILTFLVPALPRRFPPPLPIVLVFDSFSAFMCLRLLMSSEYLSAPGRSEKAQKTRASDGEEPWERLVRVSSSQPLSIWPLRVAHRNGEGYVTLAWRNRVFVGLFGVVGLAFGAYSIVNASREPTISANQWFGLAFALTISGVFMLVGYFGLAYTCCLRRGGRGREIVVRRGFWPFVTEYRLPCSKLTPRLSVDTDKTSLFIANDDDDAEVHLASARNQVELFPAFQALRGWLGGRSDDETFQQEDFPGHPALRVPYAHIAKRSASFRNACVNVLSRESAVVRPTLSLPLGPLAGYGLLVSIAIIGGLLSLTTVAACALILLGLHLLWYLVRRRRRICLELAAKTVSIARGRGEPETTVPRKDLVAVQICAHEEDRYTAFELNLVLARPDVERINLMCHGKERALREDAERLAEFLNVPVLDYTMTEDED
jgi:hypothetical protein